MCYMLYGALNEGINTLDYMRVAGESKFSFRPGTKSDFESCVAEEAQKYRVTNLSCDCNSPVGAGDPEADELKHLAALFEQFRTIRGAKCIYLSKTWTGDTNKSEVVVHIDDINVPDFLANVKTECLYRINLFERHI